MKKHVAPSTEITTTTDTGEASFPGFGIVAFTLFATVSLFLFMGWYPIHDTMNWFPFFDYFQRALAEGNIPLWNSYSNLGMPFFQNIQPLGMLDPTILLTSVLQLIKGLGVLDIHVIRIFMRFFVFIAGTYWTLKLVTNENKISAIMSVVLFFGLLPSFMRQSGMIDNNMFVPLMTALSLLYFRCQAPSQKGLTLFSLCLVIGVSLNNHIPAIPLLFFLIFFFLYAHILGGGIKANVVQAFQRPALLWTVASVILLVGLAMPVLALNIELRTAPEMFGSLRLLNSNNGSLSTFFASELPDKAVFFSDQMSRVYLTMHNVLGFVSEPFSAAHVTAPYEVQPSWILWAKSSELRIYLGLVPLAFAVQALRNWCDPLVRIVVLLSIISFLMTIGFDPNLDFSPKYTTPVQYIAFLLLPGTGLIEALQNTVSLFAFTLIILAALGWQKTSARLRSIIIGCALVLIGAKYLALSNWEGSLPYTLTNLDNAELLLGLALGVSVFAISLIMKAPHMSLAGVAMMDVGLFVVALVGANMDTTISEDLARANIKHGASDDALVTYRRAFPRQNALLRPGENHGITAPELISRTSYGFGPLLLRHFGIHNQRFGQFFMTRSYYDFMANVVPEKQLIASGISSPVFSFFPAESVVMVDDARAAVAAINAMPKEGLKDILLLEKTRVESGQKLTSEEIAQHFTVKQVVIEPSTKSERYLSAQKLFEQSKWQWPLRRGVQITSVRSHYNSLSLTVQAPSEGWLYWADGYSRHWRASVNGNATAVEKANINFKAVRVPKGTSTVNFTYDPVLIRSSFYIYFAAIGFYLIVIGMHVITGRNRRNVRRRRAQPQGVAN